MNFEDKIIRNVKIRVFILLSIFTLTIMGAYTAFMYYNYPDLLSLTLFVCCFIYIVIMFLGTLYTKYMLENNVEMRNQIIANERLKRGYKNE